MARRTFSFDRQAAIKAAWDLLWADNLRQREEDVAYEKKGGKKPFNSARTYYLTASDLENQVRQFADETARGEKWGTHGRAYGRYPSGIRFSGDLLGDCRDWLRRNPKLTSHNFGRGHISGERYRPAGEPISEAEQGTLEEKARRAKTPRPIHMHKKTGEFSSTYMCAPAPKGPRWRQSRSQAHVTMDASRVTCPRCLKIMKGDAK